MRWIRDGALVLASLIFAFLGIEAALRIADGVRFWPIENLIARQIALLNIHTANEFDPVLGWVLKPNISGGPVGASFTTGERGVRMNSPAVQPISKQAIIASGDSFTAGSEVGDADTWPAQLERMLGVPVLNAATGGWATDQIILRLFQLMPELEPKLVIASFLYDDIGRASFRTYSGGNKPYFKVSEDGALQHHNNPVPVFRGARNELGVARSIFGYFYVANWVMGRIGNTNWFLGGAAYVKVDNDPVAVTCALLSELAGRARGAGVKVIVVLQYGGEQVKQWVTQPVDGVQVATCASQLGLTVVNVWQPLKDTLQSGGLEQFKTLFVMHDQGRTFGHMSGAGNAFVAGLVAAAVRAEFAKP